MLWTNRKTKHVVRVFLLQYDPFKCVNCGKSGKLEDFETEMCSKIEDSR